MCIFASNTKIKIDLRQIDDYADILTIMSKHKITNYVYSFEFNGQIIKFGFSADNSKLYGERIYRQSGHLPGWVKKSLTGPSGSEMFFINQDYTIKYGKSLNRKGMVITVFDMSNQTKAQCEELERYLIDTYINYYNEAPIGNKDPRTVFEIRKHKNSKQFAKLFDECS